ncbi:MAG: nucleotide excision repair endonuclease [bacterium]
MDIAVEVLRIRGIHEGAAQRIVRGLLAADPTFVEDHGVWRVAETSRVGVNQLAEPPPEWDALPPPAPEEHEDARVRELAAPRRKRVSRIGSERARERDREAAATGESALDAATRVAARDAANAHLDRILPQRERLRLPSAPGVYLFRARNGRPLYVGKAKDLRRRVLSHFHGAAAAREAELHDATTRITLEVLGSEAEALLREFDLIARHAPRFNTQRNAYRGQEAKRADAIVVLPTLAPSRARVFVIRADGAFLSKDVARRRGRAALRPLVAFLRNAASRARPRGTIAAAPALLGILTAWHRANRDHVTLIDPRRFTRDEDLLRVLEEHLTDATLFHERSVRV